MTRESKKIKREKDSHEAVCSGLGSDAGFWFRVRSSSDVKKNLMLSRSHLRVKRNVLRGDYNRNNGGDECKDANFGPQEPSLFDIDG